MRMPSPSPWTSREFPSMSALNMPSFFHLSAFAHAVPSALFRVLAESPCLESQRDTDTNDMARIGRRMLLEKGEGRDADVRLRGLCPAHSL